ncbi:hypothetical protein CDAR_27511 [Caerostris darwini]|uniref:Uncharacterized protein n=1 Tax=Caerostris darwini TaxID=1538125 RepID=A0AAV4VUD0_9ARAC|nr:hypothetical protein CDAR_27511 [Caerostris darwini]
MCPAKDEGLPAPSKSKNSVGTRVAHFLSRTSLLICAVRSTVSCTSASQEERSTPLLHTVNTEGPQKLLLGPRLIVIVASSHFPTQTVLEEK